MKRQLLILIVILIISHLFSFVPHFLEDPAISPDGKTVCFVYLSDLWIVPFEGGEAKRITVSKADEWSPLYSPDGKYILFNSNRNGFTQIFKIPANGGKATIYSPEDFQIAAVFPNGRSILATAYQEGFPDKFIKVYPDSSFFEITKWGGYYCDVSKNGNSIIFSSSANPYREKYKGSANGDLWLYNIKQDKYKRLTKTDFTERYPVFSKINKNIIYFAASDGKVFQLYKANINDIIQKKQLTHFKTWSVRDISIAFQNDRMVFEKFDKMFKYNPRNKKVSELKITINQDVNNDYISKNHFYDKFDNFAVSKDGKLVVFSYKYDLFAIPEKGGEVRQLTHWQSGINNIVIMNDSKTIFFTSMPKGKPQIFRLNIEKPDSIVHLDWCKNKYINSIYKSLNYLIVKYSDKEKNYNLAFADSLGKHFRIIENKKYISSPVSFSPDENYAIYSTLNPKYWTRQIFVYNLKTKEKKKIKDTYTWTDNPIWGKDGKTAFITLNGDIYRIDLMPKDYFYLKKDYWKDILSPHKKKKKNKITFKIDFNNIENRFTKIVSKNGSNFIIYVPNDSMFYYANFNNDITTIRKTDYLGENDEKITTLNGTIWNIEYNKTNNKIYFIQNRRLKSVNPQTGHIKTYSNDFKYTYDKIKLNRNIFLQVWELFGDGFYDKNMHGVNWKKSKKRFYRYTEFAYTTDILSSIISEMIGEVNSSHTGFYPRSDSDFLTLSKAYLGCVFDYKWIPENGFRIEKIYANSKLISPYHIKAGDIITEIDGVKIGKNKPFNKLFYDKINKKISLKIKSKDSLRTIEVKGLSRRQNRDLYYNDWVLQNRKTVEKLSNNQIAYIHIRAMNNTSYKHFKDELYSKYLDKKALILDIRNNGGGYTHDLVLDVFTKKQYGYTTLRKFGGELLPVPQRHWDKPVILLINKKSFSDAEIFPAIFKEFKLGKIIGTPTSGSVIGTYEISLMDGSSMRMPSNGWYKIDKTNMEGNGTIPDIIIELTPKDFITHNDKQIKKAVSELLKMIK